MTVTESQQLLSDYVASHSEAAFRELVSRYIGLVFSTALRLVDGDAHRAQDVAQTVFIDLARHAARLAPQTLLGGWLHRDTCFVAAKLMRTERRRQLREREAAFMKDLNTDDTSFHDLAPILDEAINELADEDRKAILLRFYEQRDLRSVGEALGSSENAAQKRVTRALEQLHLLLTRRGVALSAAALGTCLASEAVTAAPAGLATIIAGAALAGPASGVGLSAAVIKLATMTKIQASLIGAVLLLGTAASVMVQHHAQAALRTSDELLQQQSVDLQRQQSENERLSGLVEAGGLHANSLQDLLNIRSEVEALRKQTNGLAAVLDQNRHLRDLNAQQPFPILQMREQEKKSAIDRMNYTKRWLLAFLMFADKNNNQFPSAFDDARPFLPQEAAGETNLTVEQFEITYQGPRPIISIPSAALTVLLRERTPRRSYDGKWSRAYGFADGHSEITSSPDGSFEAWEKRHIFLPPADR